MSRWALLAAALLTAAGVGVVSVRGARDHFEAVDACRALAAAGDVAGCLARLDPVVGDGGDFVPEPAFAELLIRSRRRDGRAADAAALARNAARAHPGDATLFALELETRAALEPEEPVLAELARRVPAEGDAAARMRVTLAQRHLLRGDPPAALAALGDALPEGAAASSSLWFDTRGIAHAMNDDIDATRAAYAHWEQAGGRPEEVRARFTLALDVAGLVVPGRDEIAALRSARADAESIGDATLEETLGIRLIFHLVSSGRADEALAVYDALHPRLPLAGVQRDELLRARRGAELATGGDALRPGTLRFTLPDGAPDATLWVTPDVGAEPDADYEAHPIAPDRALEIERRPALAPQRWVLRAGGRTLASGATYPLSGERREVTIGALDAATAPAAPDAPPLDRLPADGRRRVAFVLLDCGDWAITQYLRARGELPVLDALLRRGQRAVLDSDPPLTAAALEALVWPERRSDVSLVGSFYRLGAELAGLESVGENPLELLAWVMPESEDLFSRIGAGERRAANLLLAHGGVRAGRHGLVHGPDGRSEAIALGATKRPLDASERARFPALAALERDADGHDAHYVQTIAAELDATLRLVRERAIDLIAVRVEPLDILTHAHFAGAVREGRDDGEALLFEVYRYVDARLGEVARALDADDVLIVASDHGIRTAMEHDRPALFVAVGAGVPAGRAPGRPSLRGVPRVLAELLGVETAWPDSGVAPWLGARASAPGEETAQPPAAAPE